MSDTVVVKRGTGTLPKGPKAPGTPWRLKANEKIIVRTVTHYYVGRYAGLDTQWGEPAIILDDCAWIPDTGIWSECLATGTLSEAEPYPGTAYVFVRMIVDASEWMHPLPRARK